MNPADFIKQYDKVIQDSNTAQNTVDEEDDFGFMDFFGDADEDVSSETETAEEDDDFAFFDLDEDDEACEPTQELAGTTQKETKSIESFIKSVTIEKSSVDTLQANNLREAFFKDLYDDDYEIVQDDVIETFHKAFGILYNDEYSAFSKYLHIYYGIRLTSEELQDLESILNSETIKLVRLPHRNVTKGEILAIQLQKDATFFDSNAIKEFSLEARDTSLIIQLEQQGKLKYDDLKKYAFNEDVLNAYLYLVFRDEFDESEFSNVIKTPQNINTYVEIVTNGPVQLRSLLSLDRFDEIYSVVKHNCSDEMLNLVTKYKYSPYLFEIVNAFSLGVFSEEFISSFLMEKSKINSFAAADYGQGLLPTSLLNNFKGNYYLTKCIVDMNSLYLDTDLVKPLISDSEKLVVLHDYVVCLLDNYHLGNITYDDYKRYLLLLGLQQNYKLIQTILKNGVQLVSFNVFWFTNFLARFGVENIALPSGIGDLLVVRSDSKGNNDQILSVQDLLCRVHKVLEIIQDKLGSDFNLSVNSHGLVLYKAGLDIESMSQKTMQLYAFANSSINTYLQNAEECSKNKFIEIPSILNILESNFIQPLQQFDILEQAAIDLSMNIKEYMNYDKLLSLIKIKYPEFLPITNSMYISILLKIMQRIIMLPQRGLIHFNFLHMFFRVAFKNKYIANFNVTDATFNRIGDTLLVETIGVVGYASCPLREILLHFDDYINKLAANSTRITLDLVTFDKISIRRFE